MTYILARDFLSKYNLFIFLISFRTVVLATILTVAMTAVVSANTLDQDAFAVEKGPHFFDNKCCFCKEVSSVQVTDGGYKFFLADGREMFVEESMVKPSQDGRQWYCPAYKGEGRCGLIMVGS